MPADRMLNLMQFVIADEAVGEKEYLTGRRDVRNRLERIARGQNPNPYISALDNEDQLRQKFNIPDNVPLLPPASPVMIPQDGPTPFPGLDPPVG